MGTSVIALTARLMLTHARPKRLFLPPAAEQLHERPEIGHNPIQASLAQRRGPRQA